MICQNCGVQAETRRIRFDQNIGFLFMRNYKYVEGEFCKNCIKNLYWKINLPNLVGWAGTISLFLAPFFFIANTVKFISAMNMQDVPVGAPTPTLKKEEIDKISNFSSEVVEVYKKTNSISETANELSPKIGLAPEKVAMYIYMLLQMAGAKKKS